MSGEEPATQIAPVESPQMVSTVKLPMLKKGEYTLWSMRMDQYLTNTDYSLWQMILNGDGPIQLGLESVEAQLVVHQKNEVVYEEKITVLEFEVKDKRNAITRIKIYQISSKDKIGLGYGDQLNENDSSGSELFNIVFDSRSSDGDDNQTNDRLKKDNGYHAIPPPLTGNYMPSLADLSFAGLDNSVYRPTANKTSACMSQVETSITPPSNTSVEMPRVEYVRPNKPSFKKIEFTNARNESVKPKQVEKPRITTQNPKVDRRVWNGKMTQKLGLGFGSTKKARALRNQRNMNGDTGYRSRDNTSMIVPVETSDALVVQDNALIIQDGLGYDWSYIAQDEPTEFALMAYTSNSLMSVHRVNGDTNQTNDRFKKDNGYHVVPPPLTGNYMPPLADLSFAGLDDSVYRPTTNKTSASVSQVEKSTSQTSNTNVEMPRVESVRPSGVIIEDWVSDDDEDIFQSNDLQATDKPSFKRIEFTNARNESVKPKQAEKPRIITQNPKVDRRDWNGKMTQKLGLGFGFTKKACFVCGSYSHLIKDCDFHEKRMAKKSVLKNMEKNTGQREIRPVWNSAQRINHQNKFVPSAVLTRLGRVPVSAAKQSSPRATTSTSTFRPVNTATHTNRVNVSKLRTNAFHKSHSPIRRSFYKSTAPNTRILNEKVNTVRVNGVNTAGQIAVSAVKGNGVTAVKASAGCVWRPKMTDLNNVSKDNSGSWVSKRGNPQQALKNKGIFDSGCSRHMTGNKDFLIDYQDIDGDDPRMPDLEDTAEVQNTGIFGSTYDDEDLDTYNSPYADQVIGAKADFNNMEPSTVMDVKSAFLYGTVEEEVYVSQPSDNGFFRGQIDKTLFIKRVKCDILLVQVYVDDIIFGSTKKSLCIDFEQIMHKRFQMSSMGELTFFLGLQVKQREDGIFIIQDKYVGETLKKFGFFSIRIASTPMETNKALKKDEDGEDVDIHLYRSMIGSLMYLTSSRPDIMFSVCACSRFQVQPKVSHLNAVKRIFRYLKGRPKLGLWYPKDSLFILEAFSDSDYAGASLDRKSTTGGCQFLGSRLISWQCKKQIVVANSTIEAEYIAASHCCGQVLWIQNQMLDYGYNFMQTKIHVDNKSAICLIEALFKEKLYGTMCINAVDYTTWILRMECKSCQNAGNFVNTADVSQIEFNHIKYGLQIHHVYTVPKDKPKNGTLLWRVFSWQCKNKKADIVATSTTKRRDAYKKKLIQVLKIHIDDNVADLLTKAFDVSRLPCCIVCEMILVSRWILVDYLEFIMSFGMRIEGYIWMVLLLGLGKNMLFGLVLRDKNSS
ncbi:putative ribonuclease H-like domain-containing protein [Tanacetum coccineum]